LATGDISRRRIAWLVLLSLTLFALALPAAGEAATPGSIVGRVTAKVGGAAISGVEVCAEPVTSLEPEYCATTDQSGDYAIAGVPPGQYKVDFWAQPQGYVDQFWNGKGLWSEAEAVTVEAGLPRTGVDAQLEVGAVISGRVVAAATGQPVAGVQVCAASTDETQFGCARTDAFGTYAIVGLGTGVYEVLFEPTGTGQNLLGQPYELGPISLVAGAQRTGVDAALQPGGQIEGTVRAAATGAPLAGVEVCVTEASSTWPLACLETPASGGYRFLGAWTGSYKVVFSPEASELEEGEFWEIAADGFPTQWWNGQSTFATATPIAIVAPGVASNIDGSLGPGPPAPPASTPSPAPSKPVTTVVKPPPKKKPLQCHKGFAKKKVKGKARCVKRHKPRRHHRKHHLKRRGHAQ
jgi:hypothetical protein